MNRFVEQLAISLIVICVSALPAVAQGHSGPESSEENFELLIPKQATNWERIQYNNFSETPNRPIITATYTNPDFPYDIKLSLSYTGTDQKELQHALQVVSSQFGEDAVQVLERDGSTMYLLKGHQGERGFAGVAVRAGAMTTKLDPKGKIGMAEIDATIAEMQAIYDAFNINKLANYYIPPIADISAVEAPEGFAPYATFLDNSQLAFAYPEDWSVVDFFNKFSHQRSTVVVIKNIEAVKTGNKQLNSEKLLKNFIDEIAHSNNVLISVESHGKGYNLKGYTPAVVKKIEKNFPTTFNNLVVQSPTETRLGGYIAFESGVHADTKNGQSVVMQRYVVKIPDKAVYLVDIIRPMEASKSTLKAVEVFMESMSVTPTE